MKLSTQGERKFVATSSDCREKDSRIQQCTGCQKKAEQRRGGEAKDMAKYFQRILGRDGYQLTLSPQDRQ